LLANVWLGWKCLKGINTQNFIQGVNDDEKRYNSDPQVHMTEVLEGALAELKDPKVKKIQKFL